MPTKITYENLVVRGEQEPHTSVVASVSVPRQTEDGDWLCIVQIEGITSEGKYRAYGADGVQALKIAMKRLDDFLKSSREYADGNLFLKAEDGRIETVTEGFFQA